MDITLHFAPGACSLAAHIVLEEIGLPYRARRLDLARGDQRSPEYLKLNPRGRVPTLVVDGKVLTENVGILAFLAGGWPKAGLWPERTWDQAKLLSTMAWISNTVHPCYGHLIRAARYVDDPAAQEAVRAKARVMYGEYLKEIDGLLAGRTWTIADRYTVADPYLLVFYRWGNRNGFPVKQLAHYAAVMRRVLARPAVKKAMADEGITLD